MDLFKLVGTMVPNANVPNLINTTENNNVGVQQKQINNDTKPTNIEHHEHTCNCGNHHCTDIVESQPTNPVRYGIAATDGDTGERYLVYKLVNDVTEIQAAFSIICIVSSLREFTSDSEWSELLSSGGMNEREIEYLLPLVKKSNTVFNIVEQPSFIENKNQQK